MNKEDTLEKKFKTKHMNKKTRISDLTLREALLLLEKDDVSSELLEQALLDKRKGIAQFFEEIAKKNRLNIALQVIELYRQKGVYFSTETHDQVANGTWQISDKGIAKPRIDETHDYSQLFPKRYTVSSYVSWPDKQRENIDDLNFSCDSLTELILCLATYLPSVLPYKDVIVTRKTRKDF